MGAVLVRKLGPADLAVAYALRLEALLLEPGAFCVLHAEELARGPSLMANNLEGERRAIFAAELNEDGRPPELVGMVGVYLEERARWQHRAGIWGMYLRAGLRGQGLGAALLEAAVDFARAGGACQVHLSAESRQVAALALYRARGFIVWGTEPGAGVDPVSGRLMDEVHMLRRL